MFFDVLSTKVDILHFGHFWINVLQNSWETGLRLALNPQLWFVTTEESLQPFLPNLIHHSSGNDTVSKFLLF